MSAFIDASLLTTPGAAKIQVQDTNYPNTTTLPFTITAARFWEATKSWDRFQVPKPFTRARVEIAAPIYVAADANDEALAAKREELQRALDEINQHGESWRAANPGAV